MNIKLYEVIDLIAYDFDGVMTDNRVQIDENGMEYVTVNRSDGLAINLLKKLNIDQIIISTEENSIVQKRAEKLKIKSYNGVKSKKEFLIDYCSKSNFDIEKTVFIGNDINDFEVMRIVGIPVCPADAYSDIKSISKIVLKTNGGFGCVREFYDLIQHSIG